MVFSKANAMEAISGNLTRPFWEAAARGVLVRQSCNACGTNFFTPQIACPRCRGEDWRWAPSAGTGVIYSKSTVYKAPGPGYTVPYVLAIVTLDEGWNMLSNIVNYLVDEVAIGMRVRVVFQRDWDERRVPEFEPDTPAAATAAGAQTGSAAGAST